MFKRAPEQVAFQQYARVVAPQNFEAHCGRGNPVGGRAKRLADLIVTTGAILLSLPLMIFISILIFVSLGRPIIYSQRRVGFSGREFRCYKFRTMVNDAERVLESYLLGSPAAAAEWKEHRKLRFDPRVTGIGHILRKSSLDELPQFYNIFRGDMSLIGPRPITHSEMMRYGQYAIYYTSARPGMTGLWQVSGRNSLSYRRRVALDRYYVRRWSRRLDFLIFLRTLPALLRPNETS